MMMVEEAKGSSVGEVVIRALVVVDVGFAALNARVYEKWEAEQLQSNVMITIIHQERGLVPPIRASNARVS